MRNNIPYSLTFKYFNDTITLKKDSPTLDIHDVMEMNKSIMITLFGERAYNETIKRIAEEIEWKEYEF
jgi:hypothetical protein